ncbi:MAG: putative molybdenum cofactor guanylyltransferase [Candidatus Sericytochromatia bacterium]|nr:MAG: putative molybdenum cofactor guanylyltransferase [Candidatus Sericytochromatia bacterium]
MNNAIILAGGESSRVGENKAFLKFGNKTLIEIIIDELLKYFDNISIITLNIEEYSFIKNSKVKVFEDLIKDNASVLEAIYTGLYYSNTEYSFITSCDRPYINIELIKYLYSFTSDYDVICPIYEFKAVSLHAVYSIKCLNLIKNKIDKGEKKINKLFRNFNVKYVQEEEIIKQFGSSKHLFQIKTYLDYLLCKN